MNTIEMKITAERDPVRMQSLLFFANKNEPFRQKT